MKKLTKKIIVFPVTCASLLAIFITLLAQTVLGASSTWTGGGVDGNWSTVLNWLTAPPGNTLSPFTSTDVATFSGGPTQTNVILNASYNVQVINFGLGANTNFTISALGGSSLLLSSGGVINVTNTSPTSGIIYDLIAAPILLETSTGNGMGTGNWSIAANGGGAAGATSFVKVSGNITGTASTGTNVLQLNGGNNTAGLGANEISGVIADGVNGGVIQVDVPESGGSLPNGSTIWLLSGNNTYSGGTTLRQLGPYAGQLWISQNSSLGTGPLIITASETLYSTNALTLANSIATTANPTITFPTAMTLNGVISGSGGFTMGGAGVLTLNGTNTYTGTTTVSAGTVIVGNPNGIGATNASLTINNGGTFNMNSNNIVIGAFNVPVGGIFTNTAIAGTNSLTIGTGGGGGTVSASLVEGLAPLALIKQGAGSITLNQNNTYSGGTTITAGTIGLGGNYNAFGSAPVTLASTSGTGTKTLYAANFGSYALTNALVIQAGTSNRYEWSANSGTPSLTGSITGNGLFDVSAGFNPNFQFAGDMTGFSGTLLLPGNGGTGGYSGHYDLYNTNTVGLPNAAVVMSSAYHSVNSGNVVILRFNPTVSPGSVTIPLGSLSGSFGSSQTAANLILENNAANSTNTFQIGGLNASTTFAGEISDGGPSSAITALTTVGTGTLTLSGSSTYSGPTIVSNGMLVINGTLGSGYLGATPVTVYSSGAISGLGNINGSVTLNTGNAGILLTNNSVGTLTVGNGLTLANGNVLAFDLGASADQIAVNGTYSQSGTAVVYFAPVSGFGAGTFPLITGASGISAANFTIGNTLSGYSLSLTNPNATTLAINVVVAAPGTAFWDNRSGTTWSVVNNWDTDASSGIPLSSLPAIPTDVTFAANAASVFNTTLGANFSIHSLNLTTPNNVTIGGANVLTLSAGLVNGPSAGNNTINTALVLGTDQTWANNSANSLVVNSNISGAHALIVNSGGANILLTTSNTYSGGTVINAGTLTLGSPINTLAVSGAVTVNGGTLDLGANSDTVGAVSLTNGAISGTSGTLTASSYYVENGTVTASLAGGAILTKGNTGTVLLSGANTYSGLTTASAGVLQLGSASALGAGPAYIQNGASLDLNGQTTGVAFGDSNGGGNAGFTGDGVNGALFNSSTTPAAITGLINLYASFSVNGSGNIALGTVTRSVGGGAETLTMNGSGALTMAGTNDNSWLQVDVENGIVVLNKSIIGHVANTLQIDNGIAQYGTNMVSLLNGTGQINNTTVNGGALDLNGASGANATIGGLSGSGGNVENEATNTVATLTVGGNNGSGTYAGVIQDNGGTGGKLALVIAAGTGIETLAGANTYSGNTIVSNGTLLVTGSLASGSAVTVTGGTNGGTLGGSGTINGSVTVNSGATLSTGTNEQTLTINGNIVLDAGSTNTFMVDNTIPTNGLIVAGNSVTYGGTLNIITNGTFTIGQTFTLFSGAGATNTSGFASIQGNPGSGLAFSFTNGVLTVVGAGPTVPASLTNSFGGGVLSLSWPAGQGWRLQMQTNNLSVGLSTNWVYVTDGSASSTNITVNPTVPTVFYRLTYP